MNRPIDGIDLDELEFLKKTDAMIQFSNGYGGVALNISNFNESQRKTWDKINSDPIDRGVIKAEYQTKENLYATMIIYYLEMRMEIKLLKVLQKILSKFMVCQFSLKI